MANKEANASNKRRTLDSLFKRILPIVDLYRTNVTHDFTNQTHLKIFSVKEESYGND